MPEENKKNDLIEYRLTSIEEKLDEMKNLLLETKMHARDIEYLKQRADDNEKAFNAHEKRIKQLEDAPLKHKADRWQQIIDTAFKMIVAAAITYILAKVGLK